VARWKTLDENRSVLLPCGGGVAGFLLEGPQSSVLRGQGGLAEVP